MHYLERRPGPELRDLVECLWETRRPARGGPHPVQRVLPDGCPELIVHLADPFTRLRAGRFRRQPRVFLAGTLTRPWFLREGRRVHTVGVRFRPGAAPCLLPVRMEAAADRETPLARLVGAGRTSRLVQGLRRARAVEARFGAAEAWLREALPMVNEPPGLGRLGATALIRARGQLRMSDLARACRASPRRLERAFAREVGVRPKLFARIARLNAFLERLGRPQRARMVDLALEAGYFDQAHLLRDFRTLAGRTPARGSHADGALARHFTLPARLRALFDGAS